MCMCVSQRERERERESLKGRGRERESQRETQRERESVCVCVCVCERERERERWANPDFWSRPQNCNVEIVAIVNDAVGTLMSAAHVDRNCEIGLILGTGCNACYMEHLTNVETWDEEKNHPDQVRLVEGVGMMWHHLILHSVLQS